MSKTSHFNNKIFYLLKIKGLEETSFTKLKSSFHSKNCIIEIIDVLSVNPNYLLFDTLLNRVGINKNFDREK